MRKVTRQNGYSNLWLLIALALCLLSGFMLGTVERFMPVDKPAMPFVIMGVLIAPITLVTQLMFKFNEIKKLKGVSQDEKRRLESTIDSKVLRLILIIVFYVVSTAFVGVLFYITPFIPLSNSVEWTLRITGFLVAASVFTTIHTILESRKISNFEAKISNRSAQRKSKAALLKRLKADEKK